MKTNKEKLMENIEYLSEDQAGLINNMLNLSRFNSSREIIKAFSIEIGTFDSAYPQPYADRIREIWPGFNAGNYIFDYSENSWGELKNINDMIVKQIFNILAI